MKTMDKEKIALQAIRDMNEGLVVLGDNSRIIMANHTAELILEKTREELMGGTFVELFRAQEKNRHFIHTVLETIFDREGVHTNVVSFYTPRHKKYLNVVTSNLHEGDEIIGVVVVLSDVTELIETQRKNQQIRDTFSKYLSDEIVYEILDNPGGDKVGGTQRNITVLMSDLRGFTALCEEINAREVMDMLNHYLDCMGEIITWQRGTIIEYAGDGILAVFGAPIPSENHAVDALVAALKMQAAMKEINEWNAQHGYPELKMGIGINTGNAVIGNMGSQYAMKYNIIGKCVNSCGRIESYTVAGQVFISQYTKEKIPYDLEIDDQFEVHPKGVLNPLRISSVRGIGAPFDISIRYQEEELEPFEEPYNVRVYRMEGKKIPKTYTAALLTAGSSRRVTFDTKEEFSIHDDLMLRGKMDIYGKVMKKLKTGYLLEITGRAKR